MSSTGDFNQKAENIARINFKQNSPLSLGTTLSFFPKLTPYSYTLSGYYSYLLPSQNSLSSDQIAIPPEIGGNFYGQYFWSKTNLTFYSGADYENLSIFDLSQAQVQRKIFIDEVKALYLTAGVARQFDIFNRSFYIKISYSKSLSTTFKKTATQSSSNVEQMSSDNYSGYKAMFYINYKFSEKWYLHSLFKYHSMTGPSQLTSLRIGVGLGYIFF